MGDVFCFVFHITAFLCLHYRPKSLNFWMANSNVQKTFWTKSLKSFRDKKLRKSFSRQKSVRKLFAISRQSGTFLDFLEIFQAIQKLSKPSEKYPEAFQVIRKHSGPSGKYPDYMETFQAIQKFSRLSINFPDHPEKIQTIWKLSRPSGNFPDHPENIQTIRKLFRLSGNHPGYPKTFQKVRNLPSVISRDFRRAKSFRLTMSWFHDGFYASDDCAWQNGSLIRSSSLLLKVFLPSPCYQDQPKP